MQACKPGDPDTDAGEDDSDSEAEEDPKFRDTTGDLPFRSVQFQAHVCMCVRCKQWLQESADSDEDQKESKACLLRAGLVTGLCHFRENCL